MHLPRLRMQYVYAVEKAVTYMPCVQVNTIVNTTNAIGNLNRMAYEYHQRLERDPLTLLHIKLTRHKINHAAESFPLASGVC